MPIQTTKRFDEIMSWKDINKKVKKEQPERNKARLSVLEGEFQDLIDKGLYDKSLLGDIEHQRKNINTFDFPSEGGMDVGLKEPPIVEAILVKEKQGIGFPLNLFSPDMEKLLGMEDI